MKDDPHLIRFMSYLSLFTFFMIILVTANNFLQMFIGWEGVGLSSFFLINFWFTRIQANKASIKAMLANRVGDFFIVLALLIINNAVNSLDYDIVFSVIPNIVDCYQLCIFNIHIKVVDAIALCLFLGAMGKSAQIVLHVWLPDAMEGPTPVSALIHAATMVTAGVFLLARCSFIFEYTDSILSFIMVVGSTTAFFAASTGLFQNDVKKIIAYSTCSQLGYMMFSCGLSSYDVGIFHLSNHAFFKALLFLTAGSIIHSVSDEQDLRKMGGLKKALPFAYIAMLIGSLALIGFPFLSGFYSKDTILELAFAKSNQYSLYCYILGSISAFCTAFYSFRIIYFIFISKPNGNRRIYTQIHESNWQIQVPLFLLILSSIFIGYATKDLFIGFGTSFWNNSIFILPKNYILMDIEFIQYFYKVLPLILTILGVLFAYYLYFLNEYKFFKIKETNLYIKIYSFFSKKWFFDRIINQLFLEKGLIIFEYVPYFLIDRGLLEIIGPTGSINNVKNINTEIKYFQSGYLSHYIFFLFFFLFFISNFFL
jgi:proton-translocating NADH-quinone oxidoreductase chain L